MEHRGVEYAVVQTLFPTIWRWSVRRDHKETQCLQTSPSNPSKRAWRNSRDRFRPARSRSGRFRRRGAPSRLALRIDSGWGADIRTVTLGFRSAAPHPNVALRAEQKKPDLLEIAQTGTAFDCDRISHQRGSGRHRVYLRPCGDKRGGPAEWRSAARSIFSMPWLADQVGRPESGGPLRHGRKQHPGCDQHDEAYGHDGEEELVHVRQCRPRRAFLLDHRRQSLLIRKLIRKRPHARSPMPPLALRSDGGCAGVFFWAEGTPA